jgi:hypothetical protein
MSDDRFDQRMAARVEELLGGDYLAGLAAADVATLRRMRDECTVEEHRVSYARRILQGRIDVLRAEADRRSGDTSRSILEELPDVLADHGHAEFDPVTARPPASIKTDDLGDDIEVDGPVDVGGLDDAAMQELAARYADQERTLSRLRRRLFDAIDRIQAEIADRYRSGGASVTELLAGD